VEIVRAVRVQQVYAVVLVEQLALVVPVWVAGMVAFEAAWDIPVQGEPGVVPDMVVAAEMADTVNVDRTSLADLVAPLLSYSYHNGHRIVLDLG